MNCNIKLRMKGMKIKLARPANVKGKQIDFILVATVLIMLSLGIVMVLSASSPSSLAESGDAYSYVKTQGVSAIIGLILMLIISKIDYKKYKKFYKIAYFGTLIILLGVLVPGLRYESNGAARWINLKLTTFQPSEVAKVALVIFYAAYLSNNREKLGEFWEGFIKPLLYLIPVLAILIFIQSHLSASVLIALIVVVMMIIAGSKLKYFLIFGTAGAVRRRRTFIHTSKIF